MRGFTVSFRFSSPALFPARYGGFSLSTAPKLACQIGPSLIPLRLSLLPAYPSRDQVCIHPSCSPRQHGFSVQVGGHLLSGTPPCERHASLYSRGPRSGPGYAVLDHHHLIDPIRPTRRHIAISSHSAYTRCLRCTGAPRRPATGSRLSLPIPSWHAILNDPGDFNIDSSSQRC